MVFQPVPNAASFVLGWGNSTQQWSNVVHAVKADFTLSDMEDMADLVHSAVGGSDWMDILADDYFLLRVQAYDLRADGAPVYTTTASAIQGTETGDRLFLADALVLTLRTATRGRSGRGRLYLSGGTEVNTGAQVWVSAAQAAAADLASDLNSTFNGQGWTWSICSRYHDNVKRDPAVTYPITSWEVRSGIAGNQERRNQRP